MGRKPISCMSLFPCILLRLIELVYVAFLYDQWASLPDVTKDLTGKTVIVVGANVGLGFDGVHLISVRSIDKG